MWLEDDYETAVMWQSEQNLACPGCGQPRDEVWVWSPEEQAAKQAEWDAHMRLCVACQVRDRTSAEWRDAPHASTHGIWPTPVRVQPDRLGGDAHG